MSIPSLILDFKLPIGKELSILKYYHFRSSTEPNARLIPKDCLQSKW